MKRIFILVLALWVGAALLPFSAQAQKKGADFDYKDKIGVIKIKPGDPISVGVWFVVAGPDASLGEDTKRGVEIAADDKKGKLLGHPIKLIVQDEGCNAEGGQAAATKLASDKMIVAAIGSNCGSAARAASHPLLELPFPDRSRACRSLSTVSTPKATGTPLRLEIPARPRHTSLARISKWKVSPRIRSPRQISASKRGSPSCRRREAIWGISKAPGTRNTGTFRRATRCEARQPSAPSSSRPATSG